MEHLIEVRVCVTEVGEGDAEAFDIQFNVGQLEKGVCCPFLVLVALDVAEAAFDAVHPDLEFVHVGPEQEELCRGLHEFLGEIWVLSWFLRAGSWSIAFRMSWKFVDGRCGHAGLSLGWIVGLGIAVR